MTDFMKKYIAVFLVLAIILIAVAGKSLRTGSFGGNAEERAKPSIDKTYLIDSLMASSLPGNKLIVCLGENKETNLSGAISINIDPKDILKRANTDKIRNNGGPVLIYSADPGLSAKIWMLLTQTGIKNLYIYSANAADDKLKYEFRPDSISK